MFLYVCFRECMCVCVVGCRVSCLAVRSRVGGCGPRGVAVWMVVVVVGSTQAGNIEYSANNMAKHAKKTEKAEGGFKKRKR
jgi:hypothetical protein